MTDPKFFVKAPLAPIYSNFEGERQKTQFFGQLFSGRKMPLSACFFSKFCQRYRNVSQNRVSVMLWESSENKFGQPKKNLVNRINEKDICARYGFSLQMRVKRGIVMEPFLRLDFRKK